MDPLSTPILKLLSVLEMLGMVQSHLSNQDRIHCSLVSKAFSALFIPFIWRTVTLGTLGKDRAFLYNTETVSAIMQHARHVHVIRVRTSKSLLPFLLAGVDKLINLHTLEFLCPTWLKNESAIIRALSVIPFSRPHYSDNDRDSYEDVSLKILSATDYSTCSHMTGGRHQGGKNWLDDPEVFLMQHQRSYQHFLMQQRFQWLFETQSQRPELTQKGLESQGTPMAPAQQRMQQRHAQQRYTQLMAQQLHWQRHLQLQGHLRIQQQAEDLIKSRIDHQQLQLEQLEQQQQLEQTQEWQWQRQRLEQGRQRLEQLIEQQHDQALATQRIIHIQYQQQLHHHLYMQQRIQEQAMTAQLPLLHTHFLPIPDGNGDTCASAPNLPATQPTYWNQDEQLLVQFLNVAPALEVFVRCDFPFWNLNLQKTVAKSLQNLTMLSIIAPPHQALNSLQMPGPRWDFETLLQSGGPHVETLRFTVNAESPFPPTDAPNVDSPQPHNVLDDGQQQVSTESKKVECEHPPRQQLRHLFLEEGYWFETHTKPVSLKSCPDLQSLSLASFHPTGLEMFAKTIREHCPRLENLAITFAPAITSPVASHNGLADLLGACLKDDDVLSSSFSLLDSQGRPDPVIVERVGLKSLRLESINFKLENLAFDTLLRHAKTLRHLAIRDCTGFSYLLEEDGNLLQILESFEQLEKLDLLSQDSCCRTDQPAHMVVESMKKMKRRGESHENGATGWACSRTLKVLRLVITSVPRQPSLAQTRAMAMTTPFPFPFPEPMRAADVNPETTAENLFVGIEASHQMQREVCEALGSLEVLEELHLGMDFENKVIFHAIQRVGQQTMCLELSLESGLVQLEPLKQLRVLRVSGMDHRIGLGEVKWMCKHWPKLEAVYGLLRKRNEEHDKEIVQWLKENHPRIMYT